MPLLFHDLSLNDGESNNLLIYKKNNDHKKESSLGRLITQTENKKSSRYSQQPVADCFKSNSFNFLIIMKKLLSALFIAACGFNSVQAATILVGTDAGYAPYEFKDPKTNEIVGFDMDLINAIAKATGNEAKIQNMQFAGIIPALQTNMIDVAAAGMTITEEREKLVAFSDPYYDVGGLIMAVQTKNADKYKTLDDLVGKRICAQISSTGALLAKEVKDSKLVAFDQTGEAFMELNMGGCEAVIVDRSVTEYYLAHRKVTGVTLVPHLYTHKQNGFAIRKDNTKMIDIINTGLKKIKESGEYDRIYEKWFGRKPQ